MRSTGRAEGTRGAFGFRTGEGKISKAAYPCVGFLAGEEKKPALLIKRDSERLLYFVAGSQTPQTAPVKALKEQFDADVLLVRHESAKDPAHEDGAPAAGKFGFRWFWTELLKHKRVWRDVLLASFFIQVIGLTTLIGTQVVIDKVVVHQLWTRWKLSGKSGRRGCRWLRTRNSERARCTLTGWQWRRRSDMHTETRRTHATLVT